MIEDPGGKEQRIDRLGPGLLLRRLSNSTSEVSQYDAQGRCLVKVLRGGDRSLWSRVYSYSAEGALVRSEDSAIGTTHYTYDAAHRLATARNPGGEEQTFAYDAADNLVQQPGLKDLLMASGNRLASANGDRFEYNDRNDVALREGRGGATHFHYDARDMLVRCETRSGTWRARYDALARRVSKGYGNKRVEYYWDMDRVAAEVDETGRLRVYVYADAFALVPVLFLDYDSVDADPASGRRYFLFCNQIGAPVFVQNDSGQKAWARPPGPLRDRPHRSGLPNRRALAVPGSLRGRGNRAAL